MTITWFDIFRESDGRPVVYGMSGNDAVRQWTPANKQELIKILRQATDALDVPLIAPKDKLRPIIIVPPPVEVSVREANGRWYATVDGGSEFKVGNKVSYQGKWGLNLLGDRSAGVYTPDDYGDIFGFWAYFIAPTAQCESLGAFNCFNSYDRAKFTFGFLQYAAHVSQGDFVKYFCKLLQTEEAGSYFPDLRTDGTHIYLVSENNRRLTSNDGSDNIELMAYLNPTLAGVETKEVINAAKFIHWLAHSEVHKQIMVECGIKHFKDNMRTYARQHGLDQAPDYVCCAVADIRHQGRGGIQTINNSLSQGNTWEEKYRSVVRVGCANHPERCNTLKAEIAKYRQRGILGTKRYSRAAGDFI